uniref:Uncharacterized protein n=1 Tax=Arundo donax TaxID=35708 RepID=A0A0A8XPQ3_ARUDO
MRRMVKDCIEKLTMSTILGRR